MTKTHEFIRKALRGEAPAPPIAQLLGFTLTEVGPGRAVIAFEAGPQHANPMGTLHGGVLCDIADAAMGMSHASLLEEGESFTTIELSINYLRPVWASSLRAAGEVVNAGKTISLIECTITDERGRLIAKAKSTCMTLRGDAAQGR
jgi:uncharacterized protein (TIGR00369 family)